MEMYMEAMEVTCRSILRVVWCITPPLSFTAQAKLKGGCRSMQHQGLGIHSSPVVGVVFRRSVKRGGYALKTHKDSPLATSSILKLRFIFGPVKLWFSRLRCSVLFLWP
jgi:hypothetical protein